ncbi:MAG: precorrin-8X methylmutase [Lachnospiraceae bacterium]|nr:precorrin-8X methylmutase [Lachnospiraceae bacterium]
MENRLYNPDEIQKKSFSIIKDELEKRGFLPDGHITSLQLDVIIRCIHTTADFDYADNLVFSDGALDEIERLIKAGATIVTDTNMALAGISAKSAESFGCELKCFMAEPDVGIEAKERGITRASVSMEKASALKGDVIYAVGNAPTALMTLRDLHDRGYRPAFVIGVPVGFVNVVEAKEMIINSDIPHIVARGNKGGSTVAAAIVNAVFAWIRGK